VKAFWPILALVFAVGCHKQQISEERLERLHTSWDETPVRFEQQSVAVAEGTIPLAHIFISGGPIRIVDATAKMQVAATTVSAQTLVRVDARKGVIAGDQTIAPGPLAADHQYVIYADPTTDNVIRHGVGPPALPPQPQAQPSSSSQ
jgi:hypothetical protein